MRSHGEKLSTQGSGGEEEEEEEMLETTPAWWDSLAGGGSSNPDGGGSSNRGGAQTAEPSRREAFLRIRMAAGRFVSRWVEASRRSGWRGKLRGAS
jgi:hypothetical protein